jgi:transposase
MEWITLANMKPLTIPDKEEMILALQDEIRRSEQARYDHRLHGVLLVAEGLTCPEVANLLGDAPRTVEYWVHRFDAHGFAGLADGEKAGRPRRLSDAQLEVVASVLRQSPATAGLPGGLWDGKALSAFLDQRFGVKLKVRQCQRLFRQLGFRLRKPRPLIAHADAQAQRAYKKTPQVGKGRKR